MSDKHLIILTTIETNVKMCAYCVKLHFWAGKLIIINKKQILEVVLNCVQYTTMYTSIFISVLFTLNSMSFLLQTKLYVDTVISWLKCKYYDIRFITTIPKHRIMYYKSIDLIFCLTTDFGITIYKLHSVINI